MSETSNPIGKALEGWTEELEVPAPEQWETEDIELASTIGADSPFKLNLVKWLAVQKRRINDMEDRIGILETKADQAQSILASINSQLQDLDARVTALES